MSQNQKPAFTKEQKQLAAKKFRRWLEIDGRSVRAICLLLDIRRPQKLYDFVNGGVASAATVLKVLRLIGLPPGALVQPHTGRRLRARMVRPRRFPVEISYTEEQLALLGDLVDVLQAAKAMKKPAQLRAQFKQIGQLVGTYLAARYQSVKFIVNIDGKKVFHSEMPTVYPNKLVPMNIMLPEGAKKMDLIVDPCGDNVADHSFWAYPYFSC